MTLNSSGPISLAGSTTGQSIAIELGQSTTGQISLNDTAVRTLAGVSSGAIIMPTNFYGKSNRATISYTFSSSTSNASLNVTSISGYVAGKSDITVTVNSGVYLWASTTSNYGLTLTGGASGDTLSLVNNGYIIGCGGNGGSSAGPALSLGFSTSVTNNSYIAGGGGGGYAPGGNHGGGGGAGGGNGTGGSSPCFTPNTYGGGSGGSIGNSGGNGDSRYCPYPGGCTCQFLSGGGGGGRILPGTGGAGANAISHIAAYGGGAGGGGGSGNPFTGYFGGAGGGGNYAGSSGSSQYGTSAGGGGGGWGASGGSGSSGGNAIAKNGNTLTYVTTGNVWGAVV